MIPTDMTRLAAYVRTHRQRFVAELKEFIRFPSVSADPRHAADVHRCAAWLAGHLRRVGLDRVQLWASSGHPLVYAEWRRAAGRPTVLIYGHYDVQPADPLSEWHTPPFEPAVRDGTLYGRGASDDKGQMFAHVKALETYLRTTGRLPVNVRCLFEGEEEVGSPHLASALARHRGALAADVAVLSDTAMPAPDRPALTYALRGLLSLELDVQGPRHDLHSGNFGGAVHNPTQALCEILARLHDGNGRVTVPGFYDRVRSVGAGERTYLARTGPSDAGVLRNAGAERGWGEAGWTPRERATLRPALTINGITGGYQGSGGKAVIPARASAKVSFRLVPDQDPDEIDRLFRRHLARLTPPTVRVTAHTRARARPALLDRNHPALRAAAVAYRQGFGVAPVFVRSGGTIPVVNTLHEVFRIPTVLLGFALGDDRLHAPDERFRLRQFDNGIATCLHFLDALAQLPRAAFAPRSVRKEVAP
jgi:acetylornithine deacetylase/succinyl-diaminopimelate desuccinylase-like protein